MARRSGGRPASRDNRSASGQRQGGPSKGRGGAGGRSTQPGGRGRGAGARGGAPTRSQRPQKRDADTQSVQNRRPDRSRAGSKGDLIEGVLASGRLVAQVVGATKPRPTDID